MSTLAETSLRVAVLAAIADYFAEAATTARREAEAAYKDNGIKSLSVSLPDGEWLADITVKKASQSVTVNEDDLIAWVEKHQPAEIEEYLDSSALLDQEVIEWAREHRDDLLHRRIRRVWRDELQKVLSANGGYVIETETGASTKVAEITTVVATGAFALSTDARKERHDQIMAAVLAGDLAEVIDTPVTRAVTGGGHG